MKLITVDYETWWDANVLELDTARRFDMKRQTVAEWLAKHVERAGEGECWLAHGGGYNKRGWHVTFKAEGKRHMAHRAAWEQVNGPIPAGMCILHKCDNPKCCNPEHLALGTQSDNAKDMWRKKRGRVTGDSRRGSG